MTPILLDFPDEFESERLLIRAPRPGEGAAVYEAIQESLPELMQWMPWASPEQTADDTEEYTRRAAAQFILRESLALRLWDKQTGEFIGSSGLHEIDWSVPRFEIGYWLRTSCVGQGYATEAVNAITKFAFDILNANRVEIRCDKNNTRSAAVPPRCGYTLEATLSNHSLTPQGNLRDTLVFAKLRT